MSTGTDPLTRVLGHLGTLIAGDTLVLDRWNWLRARLPCTANGEKLLDVGCGTGAFTIGAAGRGYKSVGLTWSEHDKTKAEIRAVNCKASGVDFKQCDVRLLDQRADLRGQFDVVICLETIEHVLNDVKLVRDIAECLVPGGMLLMSTPFYFYREMSPRDCGPFSTTEDGWHVRRGYTKAGLTEVAMAAGLIVDDLSFCSGYFSQMVTRVYRVLFRFLNPFVAWAAILPLRLLPIMLDPIGMRLFHWPPYSICMVAQKPRVGTEPVRNGNNS